MAIHRGQRVLQLLSSHLGTSHSDSAPYPSPLVSPVGRHILTSPERWPCSTELSALARHPYLPPSCRAIPPLSSSAFTSLQPKVPLTLHPASRTQHIFSPFTVSVLLPTADRVFSCSGTRGSHRRGQHSKSCLKLLSPCLHHFPPAAGLARVSHSLFATPLL